MSEQPEPTLEERLQAALDQAASAVSKWAMDTWRALQPMISHITDLTDNPEVQAKLRWRAEEDRAMITSACGCECTKVHPGAWVCDVKAVTTIRRNSKVSGPVDVAVCAPCAAEVMAQPQ